MWIRHWRWKLAAPVRCQRRAPGAMRQRPVAQRTKPHRYSNHSAPFTSHADLPKHATYFQNISKLPQGILNHVRLCIQTLETPFISIEKPFEHNSTPIESHTQILRSAYNHHHSQPFKNHSQQFTTIQNRSTSVQNHSKAVSTYAKPFQQHSKPFELFKQGRKPLASLNPSYLVTFNY